MSTLRISENPRSEYCPFVDSYNKFSVEQSVEDGILIKKGSFKPSSVKDSFGSLPSYNFSVSNYEALGVKANLVTSKVSNRDIDNIETQIQNLVSNEPAK